MKVCIIGDERHLDEAKANGYECKSMDDLKKLNKDKKLVKKLGKCCYPCCVLFSVLILFVCQTDD